MAVETLESPNAAPAGGDFAAEASKFLDQHFSEPAAAESAETTVETTATDTPPANDSESPNSSVESSEALASEAPATPPVATAGETKPNETAGQPASWQPDEVARQAAKNLGLPDEVVRGIRSQDEFNRALQIALATRPIPSAAPSTPATPATPKEPTALEKFVNDDLQDPAAREAVKALMQQHEQVSQQLQQVAQGTQAHQQHVAQQRQREIEQQFDSTLDTLGYELFGKSDALSQDHLQKRSAVWDALYRLGQAGLAREVSPVSVKQAFALAFPEEFEQQLRRTVVSDASARAKAQAASRISAGEARPTSNSATDHPFIDKELLEAGKAAGLSL